ncbi:MAG: UBP-type zinc finger domain-containing protein [Bacteroidota bacterium]
MTEETNCIELSEMLEKDQIMLSEEHVCEICVTTGQHWVHLRTCQTCGHTHCCDSSPGKHAYKHFLATGHPVMASAEPGERWLWCYVHKSMAGY